MSAHTIEMVPRSLSIQVEKNNSKKSKNASAIIEAEAESSGLVVYHLIFCRAKDIHSTTLFTVCVIREAAGSGCSIHG